MLRLQYATPRGSTQKSCRMRPPHAVKEPTTHSLAVCARSTHPVVPPTHDSPRRRGRGAPYLLSQTRPTHTQSTRRVCERGRHQRRKKRNGCARLSRLSRLSPVSPLLRGTPFSLPEAAAPAAKDEGQGVWPSARCLATLAAPPPRFRPWLRAAALVLRWRGATPCR
jgi:hypothetical protein